MMFYFKEIFKIGEKEYLNSVVGMQLNGEYVAAYMGNQLQLHSVIIFYIFYDLQVELNQFKKIFNQLLETANENRESILFPSQDNNDGKITSFSLIKDYLVYSTDVS